VVAGSLPYLAAAVLAGGAARVGLLLYLEPAVSVLGAAVFLRERITLVIIGGGLLILAGVATAATGGIHGPAVSPDGLAHSCGPAEHNE
jgi:drug/metabolite transporter (DMT)-like permease